MDIVRVWKEFHRALNAVLLASDSCSKRNDICFVISQLRDDKARPSECLYWYPATQTFSTSQEGQCGSCTNSDSPAVKSACGCMIALTECFPVATVCTVWMSHHLCVEILASESWVKDVTGTRVGGSIN